MARSITERYGAKPYGFQFSTRERGAKDLDSKVVKTSGVYYLGGKVETIEEVRKRDPGSILLQNMEWNKWDRVWTSTSGWRWSQPLGKDDVVLP